jgi:KDO2-lipid IV(A) lauroyltransferase
VISAVHYAVYLVLLGMVHFMRIVPRRIALSLGAGIGMAAYRLLKKRRRYALEHLGIVFPDGIPSSASNGSSPPEPGNLEEALKRSYCHFGKMVVEFMRFIDLTPDTLPDLVEYRGLEHLEAAYRKGKGVLLATGHFGNFEYMNGGLAVLGYPMNSVIRIVDNPYLDGLIDRIRCSTGLTVIKRKVAVFAVLDKLKRGEIVSLAIDQNSARGGLFMPFFGKTAATMVGPARLHAWSGSPVLFAYAVRTNDDGHRVTILPEFPFVNTGGGEVDEFINMSLLNRALEGAIRENPAMWFWLHRRWKRQPKGKEIERHRRLVEKVETVLRREEKLARAVGWVEPDSAEPGTVGQVQASRLK